jgi:6-phosphogluconolactonase (cycloisomerase 2 family)
MRPTGRFVSRFHVPSLILPAVSAVVLFTSSAFAAVGPSATHGTNSGSSAFVYVGSGSTGTGYINGFAVAPDGSASPISGSPFSGANSSLVGAPSFLYGTDGNNIVTYTVTGDGALSQTSSVNGRAYDLDRQTSYVGGLTTTPNGHNVYTDELYYDGANNAYLTWNVNTSGQLSYLPAPAMPLYSTAGGWPFSFSTDGRFAYTWSICSRDGSVWGYARHPNGSLSRMQPGAQVPPPQPGEGSSACSQAMATSAAGYVAVSWNGGYCCGGAPVIATYAIQNNGALSLVTNSEQYTGCAQTTMAFDPSGRYLAVACNGVQVYALGTQGQLTAIGSLQQPSVPFAYVAWDSANHLYGVPQSNWQVCQNSGSACGLYIFSSNAGALTLAPGAPHVVSQPGSLVAIPARWDSGS